MTEVFQAILPVTVAVLLLQIAILKMPFESVLQFLFGTIMVIAGMIFSFLV